MNSTDGYFDVTANRTKIVTVPDGYEVRLHKIGSSEDIFPDGLSTKDIKDLNNTLVVDLSTPGTIDLKGTLLSNGQPLPTMDGVDTEIDKKITALNLSGTYATKAALTTVETTANAAAPQSTTYTKTECDNKYAPKSTTYTKTEVDTSLNSKANSADVYTKTECDGKFATVASLNVVKTTADNAAPQSTTYTKTEVDDTFATKASIPTALPNPGALTIKYNGTTVFTYDGSEAETGNFTVTPETIPGSTDSGFSTLKEELNDKLTASNALVFSATNILECPADKKVADESAVSVVNGGFIFKTTGEVYLGVNSAWVQLGVAIS